MARLTHLQIRGYRSVADRQTLVFPEQGPLVLLGENNAGKSNVVRVLELMLGEYWPGTYLPYDHEYFSRDPEGGYIELQLGLREVEAYGMAVETIELTINPDEGTKFEAVMADGARRRVTNDIRRQIVCMMIGADRRLSYQLSYSSRFTLLSRLMRQFHQRLSENPAVRADLAEKFLELESIFGRIPEFSDFASELAQTATRLSGNFEYGLDIDLSAYDPSNFFHALRVLPTEDGEPRNFDELGTGQEQVLAIAFAQAYATAFHGESANLLLVIEEPEAHLHPLAQEWVATEIRKLAASLQVVVTTHSPSFIDLMGLDGTVVVKKRAGATRLIQRTASELALHCQQMGAPKATPDSVLSYYATSASLDLAAGLFARKIVLVEGLTEAAALPVYCERLGQQPARVGVDIVSVHGVGNLAKWLRFFTAYEIPVYVIFDNDSSSEDTTGERRRDLLRALDVPDDEWSELLAKGPGIHLHQSFAVFGRNFEATLSEILGEDYEATASEGRLRFGFDTRASKPLLARFVAERAPIPPEARARLEPLIGELL